VNSVQKVMLQVLVALAPAFVVWTWLFGAGLMVNLALAAATALVAEASILALRGRPAAPALADGSALVTAALLAFALPPLAPWWLTVTGTAFAIVLAKQLYGGLGYNPFNPAMVGYVVLLVSFPVEMTRWLAPVMLGEWQPSLLEALRYAFTGGLPGGLDWDAISSATPLDAMRTGVTAGVPLSELRASPLFAAPGGTGWTWLNLAFLLGGAWLLATRTVRWAIPVAVLGSVAILATVFWFVDPERYASPLVHLLGGATLFCAFFIATDPVSAATTPRGRIAYGIGIGVFIWVIRTFGGYPDSVAFAVLLMNMAAPALDHFLTRAREN
jgi:Na+-translocating ferredoxin:NAD+ oxidoreductase subunit D